jgi:hypothetical protein
MGLSDEIGDDTSRSIMRASRAASRRELIQSKRTRHTDMLPEINQPETHEQPMRWQAVEHLREENLHLRQELETLQAQMEMYQSSINLLESEVEAIRYTHQQEIEQYQQQIREMMDERNHMQETTQQWERRYQELYHDFQDAVEVEANKMIKEAAQTLVLAPEHTPALLSDVVQTLEGQLRQSEDQRTAELLEVMRQAQYKAELLEREVVRERTELATEREYVRQHEATISAQAQQRYQLERARLQGRWTAGLTVVSMFLFSLMVLLELIFYSLNVPLYIALFVPLGICLALSYVFAHMHTSGRISVQVKDQPQKPPTKASKPAPQQAR